MAETLSLSTRLAEEFASGAADMERPAELAGIPSPGSDVESLAKAVRALKQVVDTLTGNSGSVLDKAPTLREMLADGTVVYAPSAGLSAGSGIGGYTDTRPVLATPPTITNLEAFGAFKNVILTWDMTGYRNHAYVEIWRSVGVGNNNLGLATQLDTSTANLFADADVTVGQTYYYWVRAVNIEGAIGAFNATSGVTGALLKIGNTDLGALVVEAANLATDAVTSVKIQDNAIIAGKLAANSIAVGTAAVQNGAIVNAMIANLAVDSAKIADAAVVTAKIGDAQITNAKIADATIADAKIVNLSGTKITANTIAADKMTAGIMAADNVLTRGLTVRDGSGNVILASGTNLDWNRLGSGKPVQYRVRATGLTAWNGGAGKPGATLLNLDTGAGLGGYGNMYTVARFLRSTGAYVDSQVYDTLADPANATAMANYLNSLSDAYIVVVYTWDEPQGNRLYGALPAAMYRCGASPGVFGAAKFQYRSAYILIGVPGSGAGNGYELYRGDSPSDTNAFVETTFTIQQGNANVNGMSSQPTIDSTNISTYIANAAIGTAQIGSLNASVITAGSITTDKIQVGAVTSANGGGSGLTVVAASVAGVGSVITVSTGYYYLTTTGGAGTYVIVDYSLLFEVHNTASTLNNANAYIYLYVDGVATTDYSQVTVPLLVNGNSTKWEGSACSSYSKRITGLSAGSHSFRVEVVFWPRVGFTGGYSWGSGTANAGVAHQMFMFENKV